ncbi:dihydroxyvitamin D(3) 24-hydroxylase, mitochondrial [Seminavis robusta]|uniref:Dihydroxyvitamin D(3) 24-hydroxylase, mitochondrial n=1 Tax=Seminavis robusta TaxID=568900 RepID=A0A9N8HI23_9STRA|nr:dihydroxyvitamin D(3) 24-hydroxylase, mitochondrial [Seminavis robusta]|eukprot:Sro672_g185030.1 dihydroxyvitamin D(3) 24-hydroxylase, mitochondrial (535) ;mRNA; f:14211-15815
MVSLFLQLFEEQDLFTLSLLGFLLVSTTLFLVKRSMELKKPVPNLPSPPDSHWLLGHALTLISPPFFDNMAKLAVNSANEHGQVGFWMVNRPFIGITHWEDAREVERNEVVRDFPFVFERLLSRFVGKKSFVLLNGPEWKLYRAAVSKSLGPSFMLKTRSIAARLTQEWIQQQAYDENGAIVLDVFAMLKAHLVDVFGQAGFDRKFEAPARIAETYDNLTADFTSRLLDPFNPCAMFYQIPTTRNTKHRQDKQWLTNFLDSAAKQRLQEMAANNDEGQKFDDPFSRVLKAYLQHKKTNTEMTEAEHDKSLNDILTSLLLAGHDATSIVVTYSLYLLAKHPQYQQLCFEEIQQQQQQEDNDHCLDPSQLHYCRAVVSEAMRLYSPDPVATRQLQKDHTLKGGIVAPKGTTVMVNVCMMHRNPEFWPQPAEFRPDRWVCRSNDKEAWVPRDENNNKDDNNSTIAKANRNAFHPFSVGPRNCPGDKLGMDLTTIVLATLIKELEVSLLPNQPEVEPAFYGVVQKPRRGVTLKLSKRG